MENKRGIAISTISQIGIRFITVAISILVVKLLTNFLGPIGMGEYATITTYVGFFIVIADLGLFSVGVREIAQKPQDELKILSTILTIRVGTAFLAAIIASGLLFFTEYSFNIKLGTLVASGYIFLNLLASVYDIVFQSRLQMQYSAIAELLTRLLTLGTLFALVKLNGSFLTIVSTITLSGFLIFVFKFYFSRRIISFKPRWNQDYATLILQSSVPLGLAFILGNLFFKLDGLLVFALAGAKEAGIYAVSYKVLEVTLFIATYFNSSLKPSLAKTISTDPFAAREIIQKALALLFAVSLPISIICILFSEKIILFISSPDFISGSPALILLGCTLPFMYFNNLLQEVLVSRAKNKILISLTSGLLLTNIVLNLVLIPRMGFMGAAVATLVSELILFILMICITRTIVPYVFTPKPFFKVFFAGSLMTLFGYGLIQTNIPFLVSLTFCCFAYAVSLIVVRFTTPQQILILLRK